MRLTDKERPGGEGLRGPDGQLREEEGCGLLGREEVTIHLAAGEEEVARPQAPRVVDRDTLKVSLEREPKQDRVEHITCKGEHGDNREQANLLVEGLE